MASSTPYVTALHCWSVIGRCMYCTPLRRGPALPETPRTDTRSRGPALSHATTQQRYLQSWAGPASRTGHRYSRDSTLVPSRRSQGKRRDRQAFNVETRGHEVKAPVVGNPLPDVDFVFSCLFESLFCYFHHFSINMYIPAFASTTLKQLDTESRKLIPYMIVYT